MISNHLLFNLAFILTCFNSCAMQMVKIVKPHDVIPFYNNVVAYLTNSSSYGSTGGYLLNNNNRFLKYGLINVHPLSKARGDKEWLNIYQLLKPNEAGALKPLLDDALKQVTLYMRLANLYEINKIIEALKTDKAKFDYYSHDKFKTQILHLLETRARE